MGGAASLKLIRSNPFQERKSLPGRKQFLKTFGFAKCLKSLENAKSRVFISKQYFQKKGKIVK